MNLHKQNLPFLPAGETATVDLRLSSDQILWMLGSTEDADGNTVSNSAIFFSLLASMRVSRGVDESFRRPVTVNAGQAQFSEVTLAERLNVGRKRLHAILGRLGATRAVSIGQSTTYSTVTFRCVKSWKTSGGRVLNNPYFTNP